MRLTAPHPILCSQHQVFSTSQDKNMEILPQDHALQLSFVLSSPQQCVPLIQTDFLHPAQTTAKSQCSPMHPWAKYECLLAKLQNGPAVKPKQLHRCRVKETIGVCPTTRSLVSQGRCWQPPASFLPLQKLLQLAAEPHRLLQGPSGIPGREAGL